ncbi:MAG: FtsX-like permease family protein [Actinomycetales bacterium]
MRHLLLAELRDSWTAWAGVCLTFIAVNFALALPAQIGLIGVTGVLSGELNFWTSAAYTFGPGFNILMCLIVGAVVIGASTSLVVDSRRGSLARLALGGATPSQVVATIMSQLAVVSLACAVIGDAIALGVLQPTLVFLAEGEIQPPAARYVLWPVLLANAAAVLAALIGGYRQAHRASLIPPVEALRQSTAQPDERMGVGRWIRFALLFAAVAGAFALIPLLVSADQSERFSNVLTSGMVLLILAGAMLASVAPRIVGPLTRVWTRLVPTSDPIWQLARTTAVVKASRLSKSVVPVMLTIGLLFGMLVFYGVILGVARSLGIFDMSTTGIGTLLSFLGLPLLVSMSGGVGSLIMMSKQRDAELALAGIVGATPAQRLCLPVLEGVIITVTGALLALVMVGISMGFLAVAVPAAGFPFIVEPHLLAFAGTFGVCLLVTLAATVGPTISSLRQPEPKVIARLVAE